jgi:predicted RNase H-like nuclease (RuvC/YqgF family)
LARLQIKAADAPIGLLKQENLYFYSNPEPLFTTQHVLPMNNYRIAPRPNAKKEKIINYKEEFEKLSKANALLKERLESARLKNEELSEMNAWLKKTKHNYKEKYENETERYLEASRKHTELKKEFDLWKKEHK